jgi:hypothetical protein
MGIPVASPVGVGQVPSQAARLKGVVVPALPNGTTNSAGFLGVGDDFAGIVRRLKVDEDVDQGDVIRAGSRWRE